MAQIIKHRRGSISALKDVTANVGELVMATGSIGDFNGPVVFVGDTAVAGGYKPISKIYQGSTAPTISVGSHGSTMDGLPFYSTTNQTLYILDKSGNSGIDLTGNIEGNLISGVTINNLTGLTANISGSMTVTGPTNINGNVSITGNTSQTGSIDITGNIVLGGNITIGDQNTDLITFGGEVSSSIVPDIHNAFDLGSTDKNWRNLHVSGTAYVNALEAQTINLDSITVVNNLTVSGSTFLGNGGDITVISGSVYNDQLTNNRVVIVGTNGLLEDDANFTFDGTELNVGQGNFTVQQGSGNVDTAGTLNVGGTTTLESTLTVTGSATLKNNLSVSGTTTVSGATILQDTLTVNSTSELKGAVGINSTLTVTGSATFKDTLNVTGATTIDGLTIINDNATINGVLTVTGNTQLQSNLYVSGNLEVLGSSTNVTIQSQTVEIDDNIIRMNAYSPFLRYAGFEVIDSGSVGVSASLVWDSLNDYWMFVSSSGDSSRLIGTTAGTYGSEVSLTSGTFPIATASNTIGNSLLKYSGTTLSFNTNKFTVDSGTGDTLVSGNFTLSYSGGTDNGSKTSAIMFRNSSNVVGFVSTTETTDVMDGVLGYKNSTGGLVFSTVIDGGTY